MKFAHTFCFNDQCQTVCGQKLIFLKLKTKIKSEFVRKWVCKSVGFGFVKKWQNLSNSKSVTSLLDSLPDASKFQNTQLVTKHFYAEYDAK